MNFTYAEINKNSFLLLLLLFIYSLLLSTCAKNNVFEEPPGHPVIDSIAPSSGVVGTQIRVYGSGFSIHPSADTISINGIKIKVDSPSTSTVLLATVSDSTGTGHVHLKVNNNDAEGPIFTFNHSSPDAPVITGINPTSGWDYTTTSMAIKGLRFGTDPNSIVVNFDNLSASVQSVKDTELIVAPPIHAEGYVTVLVIVKGKSSNGVQYQYINPATPVISSISPDSGWDFTTTSAIIRGAHFGTDLSSVVVKFDNSSASVQSVKDTQLIVAPPTHAAGLVTVTVNVKGSISNGVQYKYVQPGGATVIEYTGTAQLFLDRERLAGAGAGNKIVFAGGATSNGPYFQGADIYDVSTNTWSTAEISAARQNMAAAANGNKIVFAGGDQGAGGLSPVYYNSVDIYDVSTNTWTTAQLSEARTYLAGAAAGNKIVFAGGDVTGVLTKFSKTVDIYNVSNNAWSTAQLSEARAQVVAAAAGNKILFAGGASDAFTLSKTVDIYDVSTNTWTTAQLSTARNQLAAAAIGNKIVFAGGGNGSYTTTADIYDVTTNTWTTGQISEGRGLLAAAANGNKIVFAGGYSSNTSKTVDIYDVTTNAWTSAQLSEARYALAGAAAGNKILFAGGHGSSGSSKTVDIFTVH